MIDFIHGMTRTTKTSFYGIAVGYTFLDGMLKRHVAMIVREIGRGDITAIVKWYEGTFMQFLREIQCEPQDVSTLTIKIPPITAADLQSPKSS